VGARKNAGKKQKSDKKKEARAPPAPRFFARYVF
jgi:hypothetical protein